VTYSNIQGYSGGAEEHNIDIDPEFVNRDMGDFLLTDDSDCIDAGSPDPQYLILVMSPCPNDPPVAANLAAPPAKGTVLNDMGAYGGLEDIDNDGEINLIGVQGTVGAQEPVGSDLP